VEGRVTTVQAGHAGQPDQQHISSIKLKDMSDDGVGGVCEERMEVGSRVAIFFPPHGAAPGFDLYGTVVRCHDREGEHEVGVQLEQSLAA
jgi:hypothetical protein